MPVPPADPVPAADAVPHSHAHRPLRLHGRFAYAAIHAGMQRPWPGGAKLAVYVGLNLEHFAFGDGLGATIAPSVGGVDVLNHSWREYGNRVGAWRCLELFDQLRWPVGVILNTALYDHCPQLVDAFARRGDELIAHGHTNAERQGDWPEADERALVEGCRNRIATESGNAPGGWLSPWISESAVTTDLLAEAGYRYTLNWCHDDQPTRLATRCGRGLWSVPYPQELNDIPMIAVRHLDGRDFADMIVDHFDEMLEQSRQGPLVLGIALHPYLVGQPFRLRHLRRALQHIDAQRERLWLTTPGAIAEAAQAFSAAPPP